jgi:hypothetical protein
MGREQDIFSKISLLSPMMLQMWTWKLTSDFHTVLYAQECAVLQLHLVGWS